nr:MAG TPA: hypothetical protein [Caudoviricetes sp.]
MELIALIDIPLSYIWINLFKNSVVICFPIF